MEIEEIITVIKEQIVDQAWMLAPKLYEVQLEALRSALTILEQLQKVGSGILGKERELTDGEKIKVIP